MFHSIKHLTPLLVLFILLFLISFNASATHAVGADISYECLGGNQYRITLNLYRDCAGIQAPGSASVSIRSASCNRNLSLTLSQISATEVSNICPSQYNNSRCNGGSLPGTQQYVYSNVITLPAQCTDWVIGYSLCCRNNAITNLSNPGNQNLYVEARLNNTISPCNNSPIFTTLPVPYVCAGQTAFYNHGSVDIDGDVLVYSLINPLNGSGSNIPFRAGFSATNPLSVTGSFGFDNNTGQMIYTPSAIQNAVVTVLVQEFRNGVLIGSTMRDMQIIVISCSNSAPTATGINGTNSYSTTLCPNGSFCFNINSFDPDPSNTVTMNWNSGIPGATFTTSGSPHPTGTFCWTPPANASGSYNFLVTVQDNACPLSSSNTYAYTLNVPSQINLSFSTTSAVLCYGGSNASATVTPTGSNGNYTYFWSTNPPQTTPTITGLSAGTYTVTVSDNINCRQTTGSVTINQNAQIVINALTSAPSCNLANGSITASATGGSGSGYSFFWSNGGTGPTITGLNSGSYTVTVFDGATCSQTLSVSLNNSGAPTLNITSNPVACFGTNTGSATATPSGGVPPYTYSWSNGANTQTASNLGVGSYTVTVTASNGCQVTGVAAITQPPLLAIFTSSVSASCGGSNGSAGVAAFGGTPPYTYAWSNNVATPDNNNIPGGNYTIVVTDSRGCTASEVVAVASSPNVDATISTTTHQGGFNVSCNGFLNGQVNVTATNGTPPFSFLWSNGAILEDLFNVGAGNYSVTITDSKGCTAVRSISLNEPPAIITSISAVLQGDFHLICPTDSNAQINLTASGGIPPYTYLWTNDETTQNITNASAGENFVNVIDVNGCVGTASIVITSPPPIETILTPSLYPNGLNISCNGANDGFVDCSVTGGTPGYTFSWNNGQYTTQNLQNIGAGVYTLEVTDAAGCLAFDTVELEEPLLLEFSVTTIPVSCRGASTGSINVDVTGGIPTYNYLWNTGASNQNLSDLSAGIYELTVTDSSNCERTLSIEITQPDEDPISNVTVLTCTESYLVGGALQTESGTYFDTVITVAGCDSIIITELIFTGAYLIDVQASICSGESYFAGGDFQTESGIYIDSLISSEGCDSIVTTNLEAFLAYSKSLEVSICEGESYFAGGALQTESGVYLDSLTSVGGCDSVITTTLTVLPVALTAQSFDVCSGDGVFAGKAFQTVSGVYYDTLSTADGCDSIIATTLNVADPLSVDFEINHISCGCVSSGGGNGNGAPTVCTLNFEGLQHGEIIPSYFPDLGVTIQQQAYAGWPSTLIVFNSDFIGPTPDPDLQVGIGNLAIFPMNLTDNSGDGFVDVPDDQSAGGIITFIFDEVRTFYGLTMVDNDRSNGTIRAYDENNVLITSVPTPSGADASVQVYDLDIPNVKKVVVTFADSRGITDVKFSCPPPTCGVELDDFAHGQILTGLEIAPGVTVNAVSNTNKPNEVIIFNSNVTGSNDPDLEVGIGNLLIIPEDITDNSGDGLVDNPDDSNVGGIMTFTFDRDRTVFSLTLVDNDRNNGWVKAYDENNVQIKQVSTPSGAEGSIQVIPINASGVRRLDVYYWDSRGVTNLLLDCPDAEECCDGNATAFISGGTPPYSFEWSNGSTDAYAGDSLCAGVYYVTITDQLGCSITDSISIIQLDANYTYAAETICEGDSFLVGGDLQTESGTYRDTLGLEGECYDILVTELTVIPNLRETRQVEICDGESFFAGGDFQTESGSYTDVFSGSNGCDSILTTELTVLPTPNTGIQAQICEGESYFAGGGFQTESGIYTDVLLTAGGCDSTVVTTLTVLPTAFTSLQAEICEGESFLAGGSLQTEAGTYFDTLQTSDGCDSIVAVELMVHPIFLEILQAEICEGDSYFAGGALQTETGFYTDSLVTINGCDSVVVTELTVHPAYTLTLQAEICEGDSFFAAGAFQTEAGIYQDVMNTQFGCDSIILTELTVLPTSVNELQVEICEGDSYFAAGEFQTETGIYLDVLVAENGCDSILTTMLTVHPAAETNIQIQICEGDSYFAGGDLQTESGIYFDTLTTMNGCDSIVITELSVNSVSLTDISVEICEGESYFAGGDFQTEAGVYIDSLQNSEGCDSIIVTTLAVNTSVSTNISEEICEGDSYFAGGDFQTEAGVYIDSLQSSAGCDSIIITTLAVNISILTNISVEICEGDNYFAGGDFQTEAGIYVDSFLAQAGCDSIVVTDLTVNQSAFVNQQVEICEGDAYFAEGNFQTESGTYLDVFQSANGCDSTVITELTVLPLSVSNISAEICEGDSYFAGGDLQSEAGTYFDTLTASNGCDSIVVTELTILESFTTNVSVEICEGDSVFVGGAFQTEAGIYFDNLISSAGCDSLVITDVSLSLSFITNDDVAICTGQSHFAGGAFQTEAGVYFDTLIAEGGCDSIIVTNLTVSDLELRGTVTDVSCFMAGDGSILVSVIGGVNPDFEWSNQLPPIAEQFGLSGGSYYVTVTDESGCSATANFVVEEPGPLALGAVPTPVSCFGEQDGSIDLFVSGGTQPYDFQWSTGELTEDIDNLTEGIYSVLVVDTNGCSANLFVLVGQPFPIDIGGIVTDESTLGSEDGAIELFVMGGTSPYSFNWSNGGTSQNLDNLSAGFYEVTVTDINGCVAVAQFEVLQLQPPREAGQFRDHGLFEVKMYPNPFRQSLMIEIESGDESEGNIILRDMMGRKVMEQRIALQKGMNFFKIKIETPLSPGAYLMEISKNNGMLREYKTLIRE